MTAFTGFTNNDFELMGEVRKNHLPAALKDKTDALRVALGQYPEYRLTTFKHRIVRRPGMRGEDGLVFGHARASDRHWYLYDVGGDQDEVQLNIGMFASHIRVGLGFQIGRQVAPKLPAFRLLQTFLGIRPPLPFRDALLQTAERNGFGLEIQGEPISGEAGVLIERLETLVVPADAEPFFVLVGVIWPRAQAVGKSASDFRSAYD